MAWLEENDEENNYPDYYEFENNWKKGFHITKNEGKVLLKDMTETHLKNTILYFEDECDTDILREELDRRNLIK